MVTKSHHDDNVKCMDHFGVTVDTSYRSFDAEPYYVITFLWRER